MAAPQKDSLDYFPLDCNFFEDKTIKGLRVRFGNDGIAVYLYLLCVIYRNDGYYTEFDEDLLLDVTDTAHISEESVKEIVEHLTKRDLFSKDMLEQYNILTSRSIQRRFQKGKTRSANRRKVEVNSDYWILSEQETEQWIDVYKHSRINDCECQEITSDIQETIQKQSRQKPHKDSIVKDSKVKDSKVKEKNNYADAVTLAKEEYDKLMSEFSKPFVDKCIEILNNYKLANGKKYKSDYYAIRNWVIGEVQKRYPNLASQYISPQNNEKLFDNPWGDVNG